VEGDVVVGVCVGVIRVSVRTALLNRVSDMCCIGFGNSET
jgi:hypothetical protein